MLTRLVSQEDSLASVARTALQIMHLSVSEDRVPDSPEELADVPDTACVAACYRCLMSYYNQPDHELLDRRDEDARAMLVRLAHARTLPPSPAEDVLSGRLGGSIGATATLSFEPLWLKEATRRGIPAPDPEPLSAGDRSVRYVWRRHYVAAVIDNTDLPAQQAMEDLGFEVIHFEDPAGWNTSFAMLASALGQAP